MIFLCDACGLCDLRIYVKVYILRPRKSTGNPRSRPLSPKCGHGTACNLIKCLTGCRRVSIFAIVYSLEGSVGAIGFDRDRRDGNCVPRSQPLVKLLGKSINCRRSFVCNGRLRAVPSTRSCPPDRSWASLRWDSPGTST